MQKTPAHESLSATPTIPGPSAIRSRIILFLIIFAALWIQTILRLYTSAQVLLQPTIENQFGALIHWRGFDQFTGWIILCIFAIAGISTPTKVGLSPLRIILAFGVAALTVGIIFSQATGQAIFDFPIAVLFAFAAILVCHRQLRELASALSANPTPAAPRGLNIEQLWRGITIQWIFLWIAAELTLRFHFRKDGVDAQPKAREFLFVLPIAGVMTNMLMALGIKWWSALRTETAPPRLRAWLISIAAVNAGAIAIAAGFRFGIPFNIAGEILLIIGIALYLLGFPNNAWTSKKNAESHARSPGGKLVPLSLFLLFLGIAMMTTENFFPNDVPTLYAYAWHHLLASSQILWLVGFGGIAFQRLAPNRIIAGTHSLALAATLLFLLGIVTLAATFLLGIHDRDTLRGLFVGATLEAAGLLLFSLLFIRFARGMKK